MLAKLFILLVLLAAMVIGDALAQERHSVELRGRVAEVFGDKAVVEVGGERLLVEPIAPEKAFPAGIGNEIAVTGYRIGNVLTPSRLTLPSGVTVEREAAGERSLSDQLARQGITIVGVPFRKRSSTEVAGRTADGRMVIASFDAGGRLQELEDAQHRHIHPQSPEALPQAEVERRLAALGFTAIRLLDQRRYLFFFSAVDKGGDPMELSVDRAGNILKKVWLR